MSNLQPHNIGAEEAVLGALLIDPDAIVAIASRLKADDFFVARHGWVYQAIADLYARGRPADLVLLAGELKERGQLEELGGSSYLTGLLNATPTSIHIQHYAGIVAEMAARRRLIQAAGEIARLAHQPGDNADLDSIQNRAEQLLFTATAQRGGEGAVALAQALEEVWDGVQRIQNRPDGLLGLPTGISRLDQVLSGLVRGNMIVLAGRPGMGKTSFALNIGHTVAKGGGRVLIFSLEMSRTELTQKLIARETGISSTRIRTAQLEGDEYTRFIDAQETMSRLPVFIDHTPGATVEYIASEARRQQARYGADLVIIDYLQIMTASGGRRNGNRTEDVSHISRQIKMLARSLNVPVLALSQLSRAVEQRNDKRPLLSDLRESGSIEQDADQVIFLYRDDYYEQAPGGPVSLTEIIVAKNRHGPNCAVFAQFDKARSRFVGVEPRTVKLEP